MESVRVVQWAVRWAGRHIMTGQIHVVPLLMTLSDLEGYFRHCQRMRIHYHRKYNNINLNAFADE